MPSTVTSRPKKPSRLSSDLPDVHRILVDAFNARWDTYQLLLDRSVKSCAEADIHDLRVAVRRLIAALDLFSAVFQHKCLVNMRRNLRDQLKKLSPLRDVQVELHYLDGMRKRHTSLRKFSEVLHIRERKIKKDIIKYLRRRTRSFNQEKNAIDEIIVSAITDSMLRHPVAMAVTGALAREYLNITFLRRELSAHDTDTIHSLRVAFKQFRYMMEIVQPADLHGMKSLFRRMHIFQSRMGTIHDYEMLLSYTNAFLRTCGNELRRDLAVFAEELKQDHKALVAKFLESADDVYTFWKIKH
jgi:CHAD domain-containing protein